MWYFVVSFSFYINVVEIAKDLYRVKVPLYVIFLFGFNSLLFLSLATAFGQLWRLEPLPCEKKTMWQREMECLLCVSDHILELIPTWQTFPDGSKLEVLNILKILN